MPVGGEPGLVDVEADVAVVDRGDVVLGVDAKSGWTADSSGERYGSKMSPSSARERTLLSTPKITSPCGLPCVSIAWLTISPASPPWRILQREAALRSNAAFTSFETANESCVTSTTCFGRSPPPPQPADEPTATSSERDRQTDLQQTVARGLMTVAPGPDREEHARSSVTRASVPAKTFETPRVVPGRGLAAQGIVEPVGRDARRRPRRAARA